MTRTEQGGTGASIPPKPLPYSISRSIAGAISYAGNEAAPGKNWIAHHFNTNRLRAIASRAYFPLAMQSGRSDAEIDAGLKEAFKRYNFIAQKAHGKKQVIENPGGLLWNVLIKQARELSDGQEEQDAPELYEGILDG